MSTTDGYRISGFQYQGQAPAIYRWVPYLRIPVSSGWRYHLVGDTTNYPGPEESKWCVQDGEDGSIW
jgi:hypothetical protein